MHHKVSDSIDYSKYTHIRQFPPTVDSYQLLALTEALITDYSSVFYDYLVLRRQIILYCADYELYREKRGTYMDLMELPFDKVVTKEAVLEALNHGKDYDDEAAYHRFCAYDSVDNAKKLCSLLTGSEEQVDVEEIPKTGRKQVMFYSDACGESKDTERLDKVVECYYPAVYQLYIGCDMDKVGQNKEIAYPMLNRVPVIGTVSKLHLSGAGKAARSLYKKNKISFADAMNVLQYDYALVAKRMFGRAVFDLTVIYDVPDAEKLLALTLLPNDNKILVLSEAMYTEIANKNAFFTDAMKYAAPYMRGIFVSSDEHKLAVEELLGKDFEVQLFDGTEELRNIVNAAIGK